MSFGEIEIHNIDLRDTSKPSIHNIIQYIYICTYCLYIQTINNDCMSSMRLEIIDFILFFSNVFIMYIHTQIHRVRWSNKNDFGGNQG